MPTLVGTGQREDEARGDEQALPRDGLSSLGLSTHTQKRGIPRGRMLLF